ncbi:MAG: STAS domain-containing protein [Holosporales bacterium]|jgi:anti-anti-sigma regulatory factor
MLALPAHLTIETAQAFTETILRDAPMDENTAVNLDAAALETITTPGLQVLLSLQQSLHTKNSRLHIIGATPSVQAAFSDCGLQSLLEPS